MPLVAANWPRKFKESRDYWNAKSPPVCPCVLWVRPADKDKGSFQTRKVVPSPARVRAKREMFVPRAAGAHLSKEKENLCCSFMACGKAQTSDRNARA